MQRGGARSEFAATPVDPSWSTAVKEQVKQRVAGTPAEPVARWVWGQLRRMGIGRVKMLPEDRWTVAIMARVLHPDSNCIDVGCDQGSILTHMLRLAPAGKHCAFEPRPVAAQALRAAFPSVTLFEIALADFAGESTFQHVVTNPGYSGLRRRDYPRPDETVETLRVRVDRLDRLIPDHHRIDFVKIDVEGAELLVLRGAEHTLRRERPVVVFEHGKGSSEYYGTTSEQVFDFLVDRCDMNVSLLPDWLEGRPPLDRAGFKAQFGGKHWYFVADPHPPP